jgi:hypothetical protein
MENKKYQSGTAQSGTVPKSSRKITERDNIIKLWVAFFIS